MVLSACMVGPFMLTAIVAHSYGLLKIISSNYRVRRVYSNFVPFILVLLNVVNMLVFVMIMNYVNITKTMKSGILIECGFTQTIVGLCVCIPYLNLLYLFRLRVRNRIEILDPDYLYETSSICTTKSQFSRNLSILDSFKVEVKDKSKIPFFVKATVLLICLVLIFIVTKIYLSIYHINAIHTGNFNMDGLKIIQND
ncbi:hypothetical protein A3Q56_05132 [Intoshia linei]|uniref:Uncharacterized protein n=1 Tax=Intoshia linei TaxID=1819745 RepID=A0A177AZ42_9BILA|nr:hypothetical protein A3Q56_05132 [Intoshia linei]